MAATAGLPQEEAERSRLLSPSLRLRGCASNRAACSQPRGPPPLTRRGGGGDPEGRLPSGRATSHRGCTRVLKRRLFDPFMAPHDTKAPDSRPHLPWVVTSQTRGQSRVRQGEVAAPLRSGWLPSAGAISHRLMRWVSKTKKGLSRVLLAHFAQKLLNSTQKYR